MGTIVWLFQLWLILVTAALVVGMPVILLSLLSAAIGDRLKRPRPQEYGTEASRAAARSAAPQPRTLFWWL